VSEALNGMPRLLVNDEPQIVGNTHETWEELLAWADRFSADRGLLVTAVRLDGVDDPSFRERGLSDRRLKAVAVIEIEASTPASLLAESLDEALSGVAGLRRHALAVARHLRDGTLASANSGLAELTQGLSTLVALVDAVSAAMGIAIERVTIDGRSAASLIEDLGQPLVELTDAQKQRDWATMADILEFDLEPAFSRVARLFTALAAAVAEQAGRRVAPALPAHLS
jgi:hypothetical protein